VHLHQVDVLQGHARAGRARWAPRRPGPAGAGHPGRRGVGEGAERAERLEAEGLRPGPRA
jgi:hypothetical protein